MLEPLIYYPNYGLYSTRYESLDEIPEGAVIGLYNDASNIDRGLRVLDACGLITLTDEEKEFYTTLDIVENPKNVTFYETAFGTAVRALEDVDACMATASHIQGGGLDPEKALALEDTNTGDFACGLVIRTADKDTIWAQDMLAAYTSDSCRDALNEGYQGASVPLF